MIEFGLQLSHLVVGKRAFWRRAGMGALLILLAACKPTLRKGGTVVDILYPLYALCGGAFAGISTETDQLLGGLVLWLPDFFTNLAVLGIIFHSWNRLAEVRTWVRSDSTGSRGHRNHREQF